MAAFLIAFALGYAKQVFTVDSLPITVYESNLSRPLLLNVPGNGGWNYLSEELATKLGLMSYFTLATYDMRGMPEGTEPPTSWDTHIDDLISIARFLRRQYGKKKICLLGYSTGTYVMNTAASFVPDMFELLIAMGLIPNLNDKKSKEIAQSNIWNNLHIPSWAMDVASYFGNTPFQIQVASANEMKENGNLHNVVSIPMRAYGPVEPTAYRRFSDCMSALSNPQIDLSQVDVRCPYHVIQGDRDTMGLHNVIEEQVRAIRAPSKHIHWIEGAGHVLHLTHTFDVARVIRSIGETVQSAR